MFKLLALIALAAFSAPMVCYLQLCFARALHTWMAVCHTAFVMLLRTVATRMLLFGVP
jgi:hypothetical protein